MATARLKSFTWRVSQIPEGTSKDALVKYFADDARRIKVLSLYPAAYELGKLTATLLFRPNPERALDPPNVLPTAPRELEIDRDFDGLTPLYCPPTGQVIAADIIAITGLAGHAFGSWAISEDFMWLRDFASKFGPTTRVLTYGYNTRIVGLDTSTTIILDQANAFLNSILIARNETRCYNRPIIFIGHSLGCLIIKKVMLVAHEKGYGLPVRAIIFMAAPHRGMDIEALQILVQEQPPETLVQELKRGSPTLQDLNERFPRVLGDVRVLTVFETKKTLTVKKGPDNKWTRSGEAVMMVDAQSAKDFSRNEDRIPSDGDHSSIAKLARNSNSSVFNAVRLLVIRALRSRTTAESQRIEALDLAADPNQPLHVSAPQRQRQPTSARARELEASDQPRQLNQRRPTAGTSRSSNPTQPEQHALVTRRPACSMGSGTEQSHSTNCVPQIPQRQGTPNGYHAGYSQAQRGTAMDPYRNHPYSSGSMSPSHPYMSPQIGAGSRPAMGMSPAGQPMTIEAPSRPGSPYSAGVPQPGNLPQPDLLSMLGMLQIGNTPYGQQVPGQLVPFPQPVAIVEPIIGCDGCNVLIRDNWYRCLECPNFDYCENCFASKPHPHSFVWMGGCDDGCALGNNGHLPQNGQIGPIRPFEYHDRFANNGQFGPFGRPQASGIGGQAYISSPYPPLMGGYYG